MNLLGSHRRSFGLCLTVVFLMSACGANRKPPSEAQRNARLNFAPEQQLGDSQKNPSTPFLRYSSDGRLFAVWTEDHDTTL